MSLRRDRFRSRLVGTFHSTAFGRGRGGVKLKPRQPTAT